MTYTPRPTHDVGSPRFPDFDFGDRPALDVGAWEPENVGACQLTGAPPDEVLDQMYALGLTVEDVGRLIGQILQLGLRTQSGTRRPLRGAGASRVTVRAYGAGAHLAA